MNKQFVVAMTTTAMIASSCAIMPKSTRYVASVDNTEAIESIAIQGTPMQKMKDAVGGKYDFRLKPWNPRSFSNEDVKKLASASDLKFSDAMLMTDNDQAFQEKLKVIKDAKNELRLVYFIFSDDSSSSVLNAALLEKAKDPQMKNIYLLVDLITNYKKLDLFMTLNEKSHGKIKPYFYNFPSGQMISDVNYMTLPCPQGSEETCRQYKAGEMAKLANKTVPTPFAKLFLTGIYGKSAAAMKAAVGLGAQVKPEDYKSQASSSDEDRGAMLDLAKITLGALKGNVIDKLKLSIAMAMYGEKITPVLNEFQGRFPVGLEKGDKDYANNTAMWDHFTDYTHHKLIIADNTELVMGGRNIEDSYHVKTRIKRENGESAKYIFMDTDFYGKADLAKNPKGLNDIKVAFDNIIHSTMVKDLNTVKNTLAYEFVANTGATKTEIGSAQKAIGLCVQQKSADLGSCILDNVTRPELGYVSAQQRQAEVLKNMNDGYKAYLAHDKKIDSSFGKLSANDLKTASFFYLENLSVARNDNQTRIKGSNLGSEAENNKNIQAAWFRSLENTCKVSREEKDRSGHLVYSEENPLQIIFHTAYLLMPSGMIQRVGQMLNNDFGDCSRVKITFITNSPFTTDLAPINVLARYQLGALFNHYNSLVQYKNMFEAPVVAVQGSQRMGYEPATANTPKDKIVSFKYKQFWPHMAYYEYTPASKADLAGLTSKPDSLHTKTSLIGNDLIVGSANVDVRSYYMDTNNAMMIRNAKDLNRSYVNMIKELEDSGRIVEKSSNFIGKSFETLRAENQEFLVAGAERWHQSDKLTPKYTEDILKNLDQAGAMIYSTTNDLLIYRGLFDHANSTSAGIGDWGAVTSLNNRANAMDNMFKVF